MAPVWKIGELAKRTGLTVRTLHHYDEIGLLSPAERSDGGHRVYDEAAVQRLYRIVSLRSLGFPLDAIADALDGERLRSASRPSTTTSAGSRPRSPRSSSCCARCARSATASTPTTS